MRNWCIALVCTSVGTVLSTETIAERSFADEIGRPVTVALFNPPIGILEKVRELDPDGHYLSNDNTWRPFFENDALIFFVKDPSDLDNLPSVARRALEIVPVESGALRARRDIVIEDRTYLFAFFFLDRYLSHSVSGSTGCRIGVNVFGMLSGTDGEEYQEVIGACDF